MHAASCTGMTFALMCCHSLYTVRHNVWPSQVGIAGHVASDQYGKYGIIREADLASKVSEFQQWATEVKKVNVEALPKWEEKELFAEFMEDYNTGTLPHKKYYDLMAYAHQQAIKAAKKGRSAGVSCCWLGATLGMCAMSWAALHPVIMLPYAE